MGARETIRIAVRNVVPPAGLTRALAVQAMVYAVGSGLFHAGSAVFFTRALGLSAAQVGLGLSIAAGVSLLGTVPLGGLTDRYGPQRVWIVGLVLDAALFATYPFVGGFAGFLAVVVALAAVESASGVAVQVYSINALAPEERVTAMAYQRSSLNVGFGLGAVISGLVLAVDTIEAYRGMVWFISMVFLVTAIFVRRLPRLPQVARPTEPMSRLAVLRDRPFMVVSLLSGLLTAHQTLYLTVMPLWILTHTDAPKTIIAGLVLLNTVLIVLLQVRASRGADTASGAARASRRGALLDRPVLPGPADLRADPGRAHRGGAGGRRDGADPGRADRVGGRLGPHRHPAAGRPARRVRGGVPARLPGAVPDRPSRSDRARGDHRRVGMVTGRSDLRAGRAGDRTRGGLGRADTAAGCCGAGADHDAGPIVRTDLPTPRFIT